KPGAKRLLVLGAGSAQLGLLEAAQQRGIYVIAVDRDPAAPGFRLADRRAIVSAEDEPAIDRLAGAGRVAGVIAPGLAHPLVADAASLEEGFQAARGAARSNLVLVEELVGGREVTVNAFSVGGRFHPLTVTDRAVAQPPAFGVALAHLWPSGLAPGTVGAAV